MGRVNDERDDTKMCDEKNCSTCLNGIPDDLAERTCENECSEHYGDWVGDDDTCEDWEELR